MERIETERLLLRPARLADAGALFVFLGDPEAMRFTHVQPSLRACRRHLAAHEAQRRRVGCAPWTILDRVDGTIIGWGGLCEDPFDPRWGVELVYWFAPSAWGRGYAGELARHSLEVAWRELHLDSVAAFAHPDNAASRRVLEKAGFVAERDLPEMQRVLFRCRLAGIDSRPCPAESPGHPRGVPPGG